MNAVLHDTPAAYEREYHQVRAAFIAHGTTLNAWLEAQGFCRQLAYRALKGKSFGKRGIELRKAVLAEASRLTGQA